MRKLMIAAFVVAAGTPLAWAQGINSPTATSPTATSPAFPSSSGAGVGEAPIGHRQPRRADIPDAQPLGPTAEDRALDRKIKSICRGC